MKWKWCVVSALASYAKLYAEGVVLTCFMVIQ